MPDLFSKEYYPDYRRVDYHMLDPRSIKILPEFNGRKNPKPIDGLVKEFVDPKIGQLVPVIITKRDGEPVLLAGHRRWQAAIKITEDGQGPFDGVFKLRCTNFTGNPFECFLVTLRENMREDLDADDDGYNISRLIHNFSMSEEEVAGFYRKTTLGGKPDVDWVRGRLALVDLTAEAVDALKAGKLKPKAAVELAKLSAKVQRQKVQSGNLTVAAIKRKDDAPAPVERTKKLNLADWTAFWTPYAERNDSAMKRLATAFLDATAAGDPESFFRALTHEIKGAAKAA